MDHGKLLMHEKVDVVQRRLEGKTTLNLSVLKNADKAEKIIKFFPEAEIISKSGMNFKIQLKHEKSQAALLNRELIKNDVMVSGLHEDKKNLEDVFMRLTSELKIGKGR